MLAVVLGALAAAAGLLIGGARVALGGASGVLVAAGYAWSFLRSHLSRSSKGRFDAMVAGGALGRLVLAGAVGLAMWLTGRPAVMAYLLAFGAAFLIFAAPQVLKATRQIRTQPAAPKGAASVVKPEGETV